MRREKEGGQREERRTQRERGKAPTPRPSAFSVKEENLFFFFLRFTRWSLSCSATLVVNAHQRHQRRFAVGTGQVGEEIFTLRFCEFSLFRAFPQALLLIFYPF